MRKREGRRKSPKRGGCGRLKTSWVALRKNRHSGRQSARKPNVWERTVLRSWVKHLFSAWKILRPRLRVGLKKNRCDGLARALKKGCSAIFSARRGCRRRRGGWDAPNIPQALTWQGLRCLRWHLRLFFFLYGNFCSRFLMPCFPPYWRAAPVGEGGRKKDRPCLGGLKKNNRLASPRGFEPRS